CISHAAHSRRKEEASSKVLSQHSRIAMPEEDAAKEGEPSLGQGRASSKVILFGEHAVVYGVSAIAAGIDRGATAVARSHQVDEIWLGDELLARGTPFY